VRRRAGIAEIVVAEAEADRVLPWPLSCDTKARIAADPDGRGLLVSAEADAGPGLAQLELAWIDRATGQPLRVHRWTVRAEVGAPPITWSVFTSPAPKPTGRRAGAVVLCAREREKRLWHLDLATGEAVPLSPPAFDVSEFAVSRQSAQVAMIATSAGSDESRQNLLMLCRHTPGTAAVPRVLHRGASRVPVWAAKRSRLFHSDGGESADPTVCVHDAAGEPRSARGHEPCSPARMFATLTQKDGVETVALQRRAAKPGRSAIVYAQGPNRRLVDGRQPVFFHEALLSLLDDFARRGCRVVGVGKALTATDKDDGTEPAWLDAMRAALESSIQMLSESGIERIAVVGGSLGALPLLHALAGRQLAGAVLVSPVYSPRLPALRGWGHLFGAAGDVAAGELGARMQTPVLVVHGVSDELTPVAHSSSFVARVPEAVVCDYLTFPEEPHIFRRPETWSLALGKAQQFLSQHLGEALAG
jgi:dipeptidyl aminopeptidase/acylaminoacyl peptidase